MYCSREVKRKLKYVNSQSAQQGSLTGGYMPSLRDSGSKKWKLTHELRSMTPITSGSTLRAGSMCWSSHLFFGRTGQSLTVNAKIVGSPVPSQAPIPFLIRSTLWALWYLRAVHTANWPPTFNSTLNTWKKTFYCTRTRVLNESRWGILKWYPLDECSSPLLRIE